ncbi:subtilisin-like protease Glyma18g48580 [Vicia villosa]|uniref:subtilisin-like protease Glyma18g48580 n=1 Tax=Vicia villosa TaxID=3911 RepID=UPI00273CCA5F|nr:subtilisin-like protease Glyma18g48580 [Vicia villosa]
MYSCVGVWQHGRVKIIANDQGNHTTPSYVAFTDSERLVGDAAKNQVAMNPTNTVFDAKRLIGRRISDSSVQRDMKLWPFKITSGPGEKPMIRVTYKGEEKVFAAEEIFEVKAFVDEEAKEEDGSDTDLHRFKDNEKYGGISLESVWWKARIGEDSIIANLDSGIWPEHVSFSGISYGLVPPKWRGNEACEIDHCITFSNATPFCNRKLIGARIFSKNYEARYGNLNPANLTAHDFIDHGTHILSTAASNFSPDETIFGNGTAKGGFPRARVKSYKVCWSKTDVAGCHEADILEAFAHALNDDIYVISTSLGVSNVKALFTYGISIGAFHVVAKNGVIVVCSVGNDGPVSSTIMNVAPWSFTVSASTIDREFVSQISIGSKQYIMGASLSKGLPSGPTYIIYPLLKFVLQRISIRSNTYNISTFEVCVAKNQ